MNWNENQKNTAGLTMVEVLCAILIIAAAVVGMMRLFILCSILRNYTTTVTVAVTEAQSKMDELRNYDFDLIATDYASGGTPGDTFALGMLNGMGKIYIDNSNTELLVVEIVVAWDGGNGRIIGEDKDLDGVLDGGEDADGNLKLDSPAELMSMISKR